MTASTPVATGHPLRRSAVRANSTTTGIAEGSIIPAIITTQVAAKDSIGPSPMSIPAMARDCWTMAAQATPATARTTSAATMGLASSCLASSAFISTRHAGQNPPGRACLNSPLVERTRLPATNPRPHAARALVAPLRYEIHVVVGDVQHVEPTLIGGVRVVDLAAVLQEHADAGRLRQSPRAQPVVVIDLLRLRIRERDAIVEVEVAADR